MKSENKKIIGINVYSESQKIRTFVGKLTKEKITFVFKYSRKYLEDETAISMGPEFPLTKIEFQSKKMFPSFLDRIPSKENQAYKDYCSLFSINTDEKDLFVLLSTIGRKGASPFIFEPIIKKIKFTNESLKIFRQQLELSTRNFALLFSTSPAVLNKIEKGRNSGKELLKRLEIYADFPEVALWMVDANRELVHNDVYESVKRILRINIDPNLGGTLL